MPILGDGNVNSMPGGGTLKPRCAVSSIRGQHWYRNRHRAWNLQRRQRRQKNNVTT